MAILQVEQVGKSFGTLRLFENISFSIESGEKVGFIAPNGAGKSTLLKMIVGREPIDEGAIITQNGLRLAYLPQSADFSEYKDILSACMSAIPEKLQSVIHRYEQAVYSGDVALITKAVEAMDAHDAWHVEQELTALLHQLRIEQPERSLEGLSGGELKRISLAATLLGAPDLMIMDEPTNHLDADTVEWLEGYLSASPSALLLVTHDRYFLDQVCGTIIELDGGLLYRYEGNYSYYLEKRAERIEQFQAEQATLRNSYRRELEWMRRQPQARGTKSKSRKEAFYDLENRLGQVTQQSAPQISAEKVYIGNKIFEAKKLSKSYGTLEVLKNFSYTFARHDRVGVVGPNGAGKSTLLKLILGLETPTSGEIEVGETVRFGYFAQIPPTFPPNKKVIDVVTDIADEVQKQGSKGGTVSAMQLLNQFLFPPKRQQDYVANLSGGERRRLHLCTVLMRAPNFLVLDEPTNDLDIPTLQVLEDYLADFNGCLLMVSHDRYFMDRLTEHLFVLKGDGKVYDFPGNYTDYRQSLKTEVPQEKKANAPKEERRKPREEKRKLNYQESKELLALNEEIPLLEDELKQIEVRMSEGTASAEALLSDGERYQKLKEELDAKELRWLELSEIDDN